MSGISVGVGVGIDPITFGKGGGVVSGALLLDLVALLLDGSPLVLENNP